MSFCCSWEGNTIHFTRTKIVQFFFFEKGKGSCFISGIDLDYVREKTILCFCNSSGPSMMPLPPTREALGLVGSFKIII